MDARCPCGSGDTYAACCERFHLGTIGAPTAVALMRSRFSAFAVGNADYLLISWHHSTRPRSVELDAEIEWTRLELLDAVAGGPFDRTGVVEFRAHHRTGRVRDTVHERSQFVREGGRWLYLRAALPEPGRRRGP